MNSLLFFLIVFASFLALFVLDAYGFEGETWTLIKYLFVFYSGIALAELVL